MAISPASVDARPQLPVLLAIAAVGLVLRLAFGLGYWTGQPLTRDEQEYLSLARSLAAGQGLQYDEAMASSGFVPFGRAPGYPAFLAVAGGGGPVPTAVPARVKIAQSIVGACGVVLVGLIATGLGGSRAGAAAAVLAACYPPLVWIAAYAFSEALFWPVGLLGVWLFDRGVARQSTGWIAAAGFATGLGILIRPALLLFLPVAGLFLLVRRRPMAAAALVLGAALVVAPWTLRNYARYGRVVLVAADGGVTFWTGNHPLATGDGDMAANPRLKVENNTLRARHPGLTEEQVEPIYYGEALGWMRAHPAAWAALEARKLFYLVVPIGASYTLHSRLYYAASVISYLLVLAAGILGVRRLGVRRALAPGLWCAALAAVAVCLIFFPQERFRIPTLDPVLIICAGAAWAARRDRR